jgi:hypothetical protein
MSGKTHFAVFNHGLETEMSRINASHKEVYGDGPDAPTANTFAKLHLSDDLPWVTKDDVEGDSVSCILVASAPSRDLFLSTAASAVCNMRQLDEGPGCHTTVGLLLICLHMSSYQQLHTILRTIKDDPCLLERIETDLPRVHWDASEQLFPKFWGGAHARFVPSGFDFKLQFVENNTKFEAAVSELKELLKLVNASSDRSAVTSKIKGKWLTAPICHAHMSLGYNCSFLLLPFVDWFSQITCFMRIALNRQRALKMVASLH